MAKSFKKLQAKMSPAARARSEAKAQKMIDEMALDELRAARDLTQEHLSKILGCAPGCGIKTRATNRHVHQHSGRLHQGHGWHTGNSCDFSRRECADQTVWQTGQNSMSRRRAPNSNLLTRNITPTAVRDPIQVDGTNHPQQRC